MNARHECGIAAICALRDGRLDPSRDVAQHVPRLLLDMQMRGELAAGLTTYNPDRPRLLETFRGVGTVREVFSLGSRAGLERLSRDLPGCAAIGHTRYATCGLDDVNYAQPFERQHGRTFKWFAFAFNGNLANYAALKEALQEERGYHVTLDTDTEVIQHHLSRALRGEDKPDFRDVLAELAETFDGAWNLVFLNADGDLLIARDPLGFRPLCYGATHELFGAASESVALWNLGITDFVPLPPGHFAVVNRDGLRVEAFAAPRTPRPCFFEWVYFSHVASVIDGRSVYLARSRLGEALAARETLAADERTVVVGVPDTAKAAADAMGHALGIPIVEGLVRNRYVGRTFIRPQDQRGAVLMKYTPIPDVLAGKRVLLVEDSIVRGSTLAHIVRDIRTRGQAAEVHLRISSPPILHPCFYGIDIATVGELLARQYVDRLGGDALPQGILDQMAAAVDADSLRYLPASAMPECIGVPPGELCMACVTRDYPTEWGRRMTDLADELVRTGETGRTHEVGTTYSRCREE